VAAGDFLDAGDKISVLVDDGGRTMLFVAHFSSDPCVPIGRPAHGFGPLAGNQANAAGRQRNNAEVACLKPALQWCGA
jgi:hypothetical protein